MGKTISLIISEICQKYGINYTSCNKDFIEYYNDAKRLGEIIFEIESLIDELSCICDRNNIDYRLKNSIKKDLLTLHEIDHDLVKLANKIKKNKDD